MSNEITKHPDLIKKEGVIRELQKQLKKKNSTLKSLKTRLANMQQDVEDISRKVQNSVMAKMEILDKLRQEIIELAKQLKKSKNISKEDKKGLALIIDDMANDEEMFGPNYAGYKENRARMESGNFDFDENERARFQDMFQQFQVKPPEEEQRSIRKVFLKLSQKFHPDLAKNKKEEEDFHQMMLQINEAYQRNDIHTLLELERLYLMEEFDFDSNSITIDILDKEIERLEKEIQFIENQANRISLEIKNIRKSDMGEMLTSVNRAERDGEGFEEMAAEHEKMIDIFKQLRDALQHSVEIDGISPKMMEMMMGAPGNGPEIGADELELLMAMMGGKQPSPAELAELLSKMAKHSRDNFDDDDDDFGMLDFFGLDDDDEYEPIENPKFPIGFSVRVKSNRESDYDEETRMKGWEGRVSAAYYDEEDNETYIVDFDSVTINAMSENYIKMAVEFGEIFNEHAFLEKELVLAKPRDKKAAAFSAYRKKFHLYSWDDLPTEQAKRLRKILLKVPSMTDIQNWNIYLEEHLTFPFQAKTRGIYSLGGIAEGHSCQVLGFEFIDEDNGFIMLTKPQGRKQLTTHPLIDLEPVKVPKKIKEVLDDYTDWGEEILSF